MLFFKNKIFNLDTVLDMTFDGQGPNDFSFLGVIDKQNIEEDEKHPNLIHHDLILHTGSKCRLHVLYVTGHDDEHLYDDRIVDDSNCPFFPKGSTCFFPRLEISYAENDDLYCHFKGGDMVKHRMMDSPNATEKRELVERRRKEMAGHQIEPMNNQRRKMRQIGSNRVALLLDLQPSSIYQFLFHNEVRHKYEFPI